MFRLVKKLREENEELLGKYNRERDKLCVAFDALKHSEQELESTRAYMEKEQEAWQDKYSALYEKYLNLLERYEKALMTKDEAREIAERWKQDD